MGAVCIPWRPCLPNLIIAQYLFTQRDTVLDKGEMTRILGSVVSNHALDLITSQHDKETFRRLIPLPSGKGDTYGERVTGGAFEAFIGALYCEVGFDDVAFFVNVIMKDALNSYDPKENVVGILLEYTLKKHKSLPEYRELVRTGPDHKPVFTYQIFFDHELQSEGSSESKLLAKQAAKKRALDKLGRKP